MLSVMQIYQGSDGAATRELYAELKKKGTLGFIALNLFRAQKCSSRTKVYHGGISGRGSYRDMAYDRKQFSMSELCKILNESAESFGIEWGWKSDPNQPFHNQVLYVLLPDCGQISFHNDKKLCGKVFDGEWDGQHASDIRIIKFVDAVLKDEIKVGGNVEMIGEQIAPLTSKRG